MNAGTTILAGLAVEKPEDPSYKPLEWRNVAIASTLILINMLISSGFGLELEIPLLVASIRCVVQLTVMGMVLEQIFSTDNPWTVIGLGCVLILLAAIEITYHKSKYRFNGMYANLRIIYSPLLSLGNLLVIEAEPFWDPYKFIPTLGMLIGNTMSAVAIGVNSCMMQFREHRERIEVQLAFGATRWEAAKPTMVESIRLAMLPTINSMSVMGLITIPGMMTGQILGGEAPMSAVKYQQIIMFMITASASIGTVLGVICAVRQEVDVRRPRREHK
ncbi:UPF0014 family [Syncephalis plumigaleata]|nr:UPF0014 family [Syncephalis plumigaleata]